jgi:hypothetical protein
MRIRVLAIALILLPSAVSAQRIRPPRLGGVGPGVVPADLPPQAPGIARELAYRRLPLSIESYPLVSFINAPGFGTSGQPSSWTTYGMGTRMDYRVTRLVSATLDMTSSFLGGPANTQTVELGTRLRPERNERRFYPFVDLRFGYVNSYATYLFPNDIYGNPVYLDMDQGAQFSQGFGGVAGVGMEIGLTRRFSLTTAASAMRSRLTSHRNTLTQFHNGNYLMNAYRWTVGLRYNPVRLIRPPGTDLP